MLETDLKRIKDISRKNERFNRRFRSFLKFETRLSDAKLDKTVHRLNAETAAKINCRECGNCCRLFSPSLDDADIERLSRTLNMTPDRFREQYLSAGENERGCLIFKTLPCPFLNGNECSVYEDRPADCRSYPHLHKKDFTSRLGGIMTDCEVCPLIFNLIEALKEEIWKPDYSSMKYDALLDEWDDE